jgi:hypothetical protein
MSQWNDGNKAIKDAVQKKAVTSSLRWRSKEVYRLEGHLQGCLGLLGQLWCWHLSRVHRLRTCKLKLKESSITQMS